MVIDRDTDTGDWLVISALAAGCGALGFFCQFVGSNEFDKQESFELLRM